MMMFSCLIKKKMLKSLCMVSQRLRYEYLATDLSPTGCDSDANKNSNDDFVPVISGLFHRV